MENIILVFDEDTDQLFGVYDISNLKGGMKDYYNSGFDNYDDYEADMVDRGAVVVHYDSFTV